MLVAEVAAAEITVVTGLVDLADSAVVDEAQIIIVITENQVLQTPAEAEAAHKAFIKLHNLVLTAPGRDVQDGLVLDLDFAKPTVYGGSGSVVSDSRLNGIEGTINGASYINPKTHRSAFEFDGSDDSIDIGSGFNDLKFTVLLWINPDSSQGIYANILDNNHTSSRSWTIQQNATKTNTYYFYTTGDKQDFDIPANVNTHLAIVYDYQTDRKEVFLNGATTISTGAPLIEYDGTEFLRLGRWGGGNRHWSGTNFYTAYFNIAMTQQQIQQHFNATRWRFGV